MKTKNSVWDEDRRARLDWRDDRGVTSEKTQTIGGKRVVIILS